MEPNVSYLHEEIYKVVKERWACNVIKHDIYVSHVNTLRFAYTYVQNKTDYEQIFVCFSVKNENISNYYRTQSHFLPF